MRGYVTPGTEAPGKRKEFTSVPQCLGVVTSQVNR